MRRWAQRGGPQFVLTWAASKWRFERMRKVPLFSDIAVALCVKLLALSVLYFLFFSAPPQAGASATAAHLTGADNGHR